MKNLFAVWFLLFIVILGGFYFAYELDFLVYVWNADVSKLTFAIIGLFMFGYCRLGYILFKYNNLTPKQLETGYELADMSMALGLLGTVIGFIVMSSSFTTVDFSDINNVKDLFKLATEGMSTALYTTAFGLVSSIILRASHFAVEKKIG